MLARLAEKLTGSNLWEGISTEIGGFDHVNLQTGTKIQVRQRELRIGNRQRLTRIDCETSSFSGEAQARAATEELSALVSLADGLPTFLGEEIRARLFQHELQGHALGDLPLLRGEERASFSLQLTNLNLWGRAHTSCRLKYRPLGERTIVEALAIIEGPENLSPTDKSLASRLRRLQR